MWLKFGVLFVVLLTACAGEEAPIAPENEVREAPNRPSPEPGPDGPNTGTTNNNNPQTNNNQPGECTDACETDDSRCAGRDTERCVVGVDGCLAWERVGCPNDEACVDGECVEAAECVDSDNDGYGENCPAGPDCDDNDGDVNPDASEMCDDIDNNCDGQIDEDYTIGQPCTAGQGTCQGSGFTRCSDDGTTTVCGAQAGNGDPEVCDGIDNDCNGMIDEGDVCAFCNSDSNEPNDAIATSTTMDGGTRNYLSVCPGDTDFFQAANLTPGMRYLFTVKYPANLSDIDIEGYIDGVKQVTVSRPDDNLAIVFTAQQGETYNFSAINQGGKENVYFASLVPENARACSVDDSFAPNYTINTAPLFFPFWTTENTICPGTSDWFRMSSINQNDTISIAVDAISLANFDLYLWGDPDGDNTFNVIAEASDLFEDDELITLTAPYTGTYFYEVRTTSGLTVSYRTSWQN